MKRKIINLCKCAMGLKDDKKVTLSSIPIPLKKYLSFFLLVSIGVFIISTIGTIAEKDLLWVMGYFISLAFVLYSVYLLLGFIYQRYELIAGTCVEMSINTLRRERCTVFMKDKDGITYSFILTNRKSSHIRIGDLVHVYACDKSSVYEKEGVYIISQYYTAVKAPIKDQLA